MKKLLAFAAVLTLAGAGCSSSTATSVDVQTNTAPPMDDMQAAPPQPAPSTTGTEVKADIHVDTNTNGTKLPVKVDVGAKASITVAATIQGYAFAPQTITVKKGDKIVFTNKDAVAHTVTSDTGLFESGMINQNTSFTLDTSKLAAGTYKYHCTPHPMMTGTIVIQ